MMKTVVCKKEGCSGNEFYIETIDDKLQVTCKECKNKFLVDMSKYEFMLLPNCSKCNESTFKLFTDIDKGDVYIKCTNCGEPPQKIYTDEDGVQVTYETKLLQNIKELINQVDQRICNVEMKIETIDKGQDILEESLAYINRYILVKKD